VSLQDYFLNSASNVIELDMFVISHTMFSQDYYVVRNSTQQIVVKHEDLSLRTYVYYPVRFSFDTVRADLDQIIKIEFGELGEILPKELDNLRLNNGFGELPSLVYRSYRSDDLDHVLSGPYLLEIKSMNFASGGCNFEAKAPSLNVSRTGERYTIGRFPMLRSTL